MSSYHVLKPGTSAAWVSEATGVPLVTTVFGEIFDKPDLHRRRIDDGRYVFDRSSSVLSCSRHCASSAASVLGLEHAVDVMYYGVDTERFGAAAAGAQERARFAVAEDDLVVLYVARMVEEMGLDVLLASVPELFRLRPRARVMVAGASGPLTVRATELAARLPAGRLTVHPDVPEKDLPTLYALSHVVAAPSSNSRACLGLAIAEAMSARRPVVACAVGGTAEVVVDGDSGTLVPPRDPSALARGLAGYLADDELRRQHGDAGRRRALELFDVRRTNERCEELFQRVIAAPRPGITRRSAENPERIRPPA
jgi:glycosyltransferase involved in cell wall biosynthesis